MEILLNEVFINHLIGFAVWLAIVFVIVAFQAWRKDRANRRYYDDPNSL